MIENINCHTAIFVCSVHARENISTDLVCKMIDDEIFNECKGFNISFVLMLNADGVELCNFGLLSAPLSQRKKLFEMNKQNYDFSLWKANGRGVDLNNNFNANWNTNVGSDIPSFQGFCGEYFESEPETRALVEYVSSINPFFSVSYHTKGEEIYYNFFQTGKHLERDRFIAEKFAQSTGYVIKNPEQISSGGFKDFCVQKLKIPAITIELGSDLLEHPIQKDSLQEIFEKNKNVAKDLQYAYNVFNKFKD